jgi:hypothetical protein
VADQDLVTVFVPEEPTELGLVESLLREHGIPFATKNSELQNLFGAGEIGAYNLAVGPVAVQVSGADAERSRELIAEALGDEAEESVEPESVESAREDSPAEEQAFRYARYSIVWGVLWFGGVGSLLAVYFGLKALSSGRQASRVSKRRAKFGLAIGLTGMVLWFLVWGSSLFG